MEIETRKAMNRTDLLNHLAEKYNLQRYLEIGVQVPELNFEKIKCKFKVGVDPAPDIWSDHGNIYHMTSDFFLDKVAYALGYNDNQFDLIFIDGLHTAEQVKKDFEGCLKYLSPNGFIVLHDTNPETYERTIVPRPTPSGPWNGDVYKFATTLYMNDFVTVDIDNGVSVFKNTGNGRAIMIDRSNWNYTWEHFVADRKEDLNLISWDEFIAAHSHV